MILDITFIFKYLKLDILLAIFLFSCTKLNYVHQLKWPLIFPKKMYPICVCPGSVSLIHTFHDFV